MATEEEKPDSGNTPEEEESTPVDSSVTPEESFPVDPPVIPEESLSPALSPSPKSKREKKSSGAWGIVVFFFLVIAGGVGAGGYYLYQEQLKFQNETRAKIAQLEAQLSALDTEADQTRQNKQSLDALNRNLQQFKSDMDATLKTHQNSLATLDEDVMRLKEKVENKAQLPPVPPSLIDGIDPPTLAPLESPAPEQAENDLLDDLEAEEGKQKQESQKFIEWMENFFAAIWNWITGLFN
ncbi:MAG: hypothetical protein OEZ51_03645 [Nitrospinota bacterium]|nr:hypothetical protein [Nitrospinota bacterium]